MIFFMTFVSSPSCRWCAVGLQLLHLLQRLIYIHHSTYSMCIFWTGREIWMTQRKPSATQAGHTITTHKGPPPIPRLNMGPSRYLFYWFFLSFPQYTSVSWHLINTLLSELSEGSRGVLSDGDKTEVMRDGTAIQLLNEATLSAEINIQLAS